MKNEPLYVQCIKLPKEATHLLQPMKDLCQSIPQSTTLTLQEENTDSISIFIYEQPTHLDEVTEILQELNNYTQMDFIAIPIPVAYSPELEDKIHEAIREKAFVTTVLYDNIHNQYLACLYYPDDYNLDEMESSIFSAIQ